ncbi:MAG: hypothetical protein PHP97_01235 [Candidatus Shapirobacteria bacterium]|nr:hypothetical protein [Candidatus Shapirobacteria bacterium]MDD4382650.1 hypothetical protein [Candidatus Shapirobacteria bacterium]
MATKKVTMEIKNITSNINIGVFNVKKFKPTRQTDDNTIIAILVSLILFLDIFFTESPPNIGNLLVIKELPSG